MDASMRAPWIQLFGGMMWLLLASVAIICGQLGEFGLAIGFGLVCWFSLLVALGWNSDFMIEIRFMADTPAMYLQFAVFMLFAPLILLYRRFNKLDDWWRVLVSYSTCVVAAMGCIVFQELYPVFVVIALGSGLLTVRYFVNAMNGRPVT